MGLFGGKKHIKSKKELQDALKKEKYLTYEERKTILKKAEKYIKEPSGLSKEEWRKKVVRPLEKAPQDKIEPNEAWRLRKFGK